MEGLDKSEELGTLLTIKGRTGTLIRAALAHGEGFEEVQVHLDLAIPRSQKQNVRVFKTDSPFTLNGSLRKLRQTYPNLDGILEDVMHGKIRVEQYYGQKACKPGGELTSMDRKFFGTGRWNHDYATDPKLIKEAADEAEDSFERTRIELTKEQAEECLDAGPIEGTAAEYGKMLACITLAHSKEMQRRCKKKPKKKPRKCLLDQFRNQARHFSFLMNNDVRLGRLSPVDRKESIFGTTSNEALHLETKSWNRMIVRQSEELYKCKAVVLTFVKVGGALLKRNHITGETQKTIVGVLSNFLRQGQDIIFDDITGEEEAERKRRKERAQAREKVIQQARHDQKVRKRKERLGPRGSKIVTKDTVESRARTYAKRTGGPVALSLNKAATKERDRRQLMKRKAEQQEQSGSAGVAGPEDQWPALIATKPARETLKGSAIRAARLEKSKKKKSKVKKPPTKAKAKAKRKPIISAKGKGKAKAKTLGRKPIGQVAMTDKERAQRRRDKLKREALKESKEES